MCVCWEGGFLFPAKNACEGGGVILDRPQLVVSLPELTDIRPTLTPLPNPTWFAGATSN